MILFYNKVFIMKSWLQLSFPRQFKSQKDMILKYISPIDWWNLDTEELFL